MNPSTEVARALVDELVRGGIREAVLAPGSRSAPLAFALRDADLSGRLRLHVRIDERSAGFLALGLARATHVPAVVVTTSGTAAVNLHPAVVEASYGEVPMVVLTADRPPELQGVGANQTIDQRELFGGSTRLFAELVADADHVADARTLARQAVAAAADGPAHLNVAFREPLVPDAVDARGDATAAGLIEGLPGRPADVGPRHQEAEDPAQGPPDLPARGVVVLGAGAAGLASQAHQLARSVGWPVLAEPGSGGRVEGSIRGYPLMLADDEWRRRHRADVVVVVGRPTVSRSVPRFVREAVEHWLVDPRGRWLDPVGTATRRLTTLPRPGRTAGPTWRADWELADARATDAVARVLGDGALTGPSIASTVLACARPGSIVVLGASQVMRDVDAFAEPRSDLRLLANRGASGIDGTVSTAVGAALAHRGAAYALMGDLTFLHDANGLVIGPEEPRPDLTLVVNNDDGGAIFHLLEQGDPAHAAAFERVFGTPHGVAIAGLCAASGTPYTLAGSTDELADALRGPEGIRVVEARTDRAAVRDLHRVLREVVAAALAG